MEPAEKHKFAAAATRWVHPFGTAAADVRTGTAELLGSKGANLAGMAALGLPVPPGFTITTEVCQHFFANGGRLPEALRPEVEAALTAVGWAAGSRFGDVVNPLLVAVRSGARVSMPGMMDTILNLGLNDRTVEGLADRARDARFAFDTYRRFIEMYADVVMGVDHGVFDDILERFKNLEGLSLDTELGAGEWRRIVSSYKEAILCEKGEIFPQDTAEQLWGAIGAVFGSWRNTRAADYRRIHDISEDWGTAVTIQSMVFGNRGPTSATGVAFTRNPSTGAKEIYGEFLVNAQGEEIVSGSRTPQPITERARLELAEEAPSLETLMPSVFAELRRVFGRLERHYRDMQDVEFTIENGTLWMLQTRSGRRTVEASLEIAVDLARERVITEDEAVLMVDPRGLDQLLHPTLDPRAPRQVIATGLPASPGAAVGEIVFDADDAQSLAGQGREVILVRPETRAEDIHGMHAAAGILTARGGLTSHAAVVARGMGRPCISGAGTLRIDLAARTMAIGGRVLAAGDVITIDGSTGQVLDGRVALSKPGLPESYRTLLGWADTARRLGVRANADQERDAAQARELGADGIGLCRTEHMFFDESRILAMREMICAKDESGRETALARMLPVQRADFERLFEVMAGLPVTIRLLDPPLHEFLPRAEREQRAVAAALGIGLDVLKARLEELTEINPMLGLRGARLLVRFPEIVRMQARAMFEAALDAAAKTGKPVALEIMVPLIAFRAEFDSVVTVVHETARAVETERNRQLTYEVGAMIELPRAALRADALVREPRGANFVSFGTNDLTQTTLGLSRDDSGAILSNYLKARVLDRDPFQTIDETGVGELVRIGIARGRSAKANLKVGVCGEHGGDPASIAFFDSAGADYVSCSPFRVPLARLAAAQSALRQRLEDTPASGG